MAETKRKILLAVDSSEFAEIAYNWYVSHIKVQDDFLILCHCPEIPVVGSATGGFAFSPSTWHEFYNAELVKVKALQHQYEHKMKHDKVSGKWISFNNYSGKVGESIIHVAEEEKPKLIIIGSRGLSTVRRTMLGSVSDFVVHHAHCPVAVVKTPHE